MSEVNVKTAQRTPGPWWAGLEYDGDSGAYFVHHKGHPIADCNMGYGLEDEANARLIAAAPEMFEALRALLGVAVADLAINPSPHPHRVMAVKNAEAAIAKAEAR